jgi:aspartyl-tRNA(Asn)/glutamyl-tRNA(Gln) amidotransferase subunit A
MFDASIAEMSASLRAKRFSSVELTRELLARIDALDGKLNTFITVDPARAVADAEAADAVIAKGDGGPLTGIPIAHKDILVTAGMRTTCGSRMLADYTSPFDAHVVDRLARAGTVLVGKTNMDEFAMGSSSETSYFGSVKNPWNLAYVPGGSSGGTAAAVAARLVAGGTGTDTGGSIRQPAAMSGVCGLKPTYGVCSRYGLVAFASSLDQAGPFARTAQDLALLLSAMAGHDPRDSTSLDRPSRIIRGSSGPNAARSHCPASGSGCPPNIRARGSTAMSRSRSAKRSTCCARSAPSPSTWRCRTSSCRFPSTT